MPLPFVKLVAAGNAYLALDGRGHERDWGALARAMCDDHFGAGSDGLLVAVRSERVALGLRIWNSDGSEAEMSGNGVRLFAKFALEGELARASEPGGLAIETRAGCGRCGPCSKPACSASRSGTRTPSTGPSNRWTPSRSPSSARGSSATRSFRTG
jgi:diaminopimelate epimerase